MLAKDLYISLPQNVIKFVEVEFYTICSFEKSRTTLINSIIKMIVVIVLHIPNGSSQLAGCYMIWKRYFFYQYICTRCHDTMNIILFFYYFVYPFFINIY